MKARKPMNMQTIMPPATCFFVARYVCEQVLACVYMCIHVFHGIRESVLYTPGYEILHFLFTHS